MNNAIPPTDRPSTVHLLDVGSRYEAEILTSWIGRETGSKPNVVRIRSSRRGRGGDIAHLEHVLSGDEETLLLPTRVLWMPPKRSGTRSVTWIDLLKLGDPRDPRGLRPRIIKNLRRKRVAYIVGKGATVGRLRSDHASSETLDSFASFVTRRAWRALDLTEREKRGNRYKTPRFVPEAIGSRREFKLAIQAVAEAEGMDPESAEKKAMAYLTEIAATHSPLAIDLVANAIHKLYRQGYGEIRYDESQIRRVAELGEKNPIVFLPSHRSNMDRLSLQFMLWENDLPPNHTAGGINLNFFPIGPILRRTGVFFIRRSFRGNDLYKTVLRHYLDYLIEKRFSLEWYLEGGRSRSGRLLPPRMGLLNYVVDSQRRGKAEDVVLLPISIAYDQIQDVPDYAREAKGHTKEGESLTWLFKTVRSLRSRYGDIHIRFGEPVSVANWTGPAAADEPTLAVQKLAFEVMYRIGQATPVTPTSLVSIALLTAQGKAKTAGQLSEQYGRLRQFVWDRGLPTSENLDFDAGSRTTSILDWLAENDNVSSHEALGRKVYWLDDDQMHRVSYYRNNVVHFFLDRSVAEVALAGLDDRVSVDAFNNATLDLRDLLKFEFFFPDKGEFLEAVSQDVEIDAPGWRNILLTSGPETVLQKLGPPVSRWALLPFLDAYQIVADELVAATGPHNEKKFLKACLDRARMYRIEDETILGESASQILFKSALALAENRDLLEGSANLATARQEFAAEIEMVRKLVRRLDRESAEESAH